MKKITLALSLLSAVLLSACAPVNGGTSSSDEIPGGESFGDDSYEVSSIDPESKKTCVVYFFLDYLHVDTINPYHSYKWFQNEVLDPSQTPETPTPPDPNFPTFLGWSDHSLLDDPEDLWDFETDKTPKRDKYLYLYAIWVD